MPLRLTGRQTFREAIKAKVGTFAARQTAALFGSGLYVATDDEQLWYSDKSTWTEVRSVPRGHLSGLNLTIENAQDVNFSVGECRAGISSDADILGVRRAEITKTLDGGGSWTVADDQQGRPSTTALGAEKWWHCFIIEDGAGVVDAGFDTSATAANLLAESSYTNYRRVGSVQETAAGDGTIYAFAQQGDYFWRDIPKGDYSANSIGTAQVDVTLSVPLGIQTMPIATYQLATQSGTNVEIIILNPTQTDTVPTIDLMHGRVFSSGADDSYIAVSPQVLTDTSSQLSHRLTASAADIVLKIATHGWIDRRGKDD